MFLKKNAYLAMVLLTAACTAGEDDGTLASGTVPVGFVASVAHAPSTRAANSIESQTSLKDAGGFGVFACYTGLYKYVDSNVHPDFMYNEHVTSTDGTSWTYSPVKYWPNGEGMTNSSINTGENKHYVSFFAYAPYSDLDADHPDTQPNGYCIPSLSLQGDLGNPWLTYRLHPDLTKQVDLLCARPVLDKAKPTVSEKVEFVFDHALACVGNKVIVECTPGLKSQIDSRVNGVTITEAKVEVTSLQITYRLTSKARLVLWNNGEANWQTILSETPTTTRTIVFRAPNDASDDVTIYHKISGSDAGNTPLDEEGQGVYYIPIELSGYEQTADVSLTYRVATYSGGSWKYDDEKNGTGTIVLHDYTTAPNDGYQPGKHLYINVALSPMDIALTAAIAPWTAVDPVDVEGIEE